MTSRRPSRRLPRLLLLVVIRSVRSSASSDGGRAAAPVRAVLFDFDGSLVQSEETHRLSFSAVLKRDLDHETWYTKCVGRRPLTILEEFRHPDSPPAEELAALLKADAVSRYDKVSATDGHSDLLDDLDRAGICMAIVSSGTRAYIERVLSRLEIADRFKLIIAGDDPEVEGHHKPDPLPYLLAAQRLGFEPSECVAVEDSPAGIASALAAGMRVVALRNPANRAHSVLLHKAVVAQIDDFHGLPRTVLGCVVGKEPPIPAAWTSEQ